MEGEEEEKNEKTKNCLNTDSDESSCPGCGAPALPFSQRLLEDNCGHKKCRKCLLVEESGCSQCEAQNYQKENGESPEEPSQNVSTSEKSSAPIQSTTSNVQHSSSLASNASKASLSPSLDNNGTEVSDNVNLPSKVINTHLISDIVSSQPQPVISSNNLLSDATILSKPFISSTSSVLPSLSYVTASTSSTQPVFTTVGASIEYLVSKDCSGFPPPLEAKVIAINSETVTPEYASSKISKPLSFNKEKQKIVTILDKDSIPLYSFHPEDVLEHSPQQQDVHHQNIKDPSSSQFVVKQGDKTCDKSDDASKHTTLIKPVASNLNVPRMSVIVPNKNRIQFKPSDISDSTPNNDPTPQTSKHPRSLDFESSLEEKLRKELIEKARDATSAAFYDAAQQYTNNFYSQIDDTTHYPKHPKNNAVNFTYELENTAGNQSENPRNITTPSDDSQENAAEHRFNDDIPIQSNMEQNLINELSVHFQDIREEDNTKFPHQLPKGYNPPSLNELEDEQEPHEYLSHEIDNHRKKVEQKQNIMSSVEDLRLYSQQNKLSHWQRTKLQKDLMEDSLNQQQNLPRDYQALLGDPHRNFLNQRKDCLLLNNQEEMQSTLQANPNEGDIRVQNNLLLEQAEAESTRSYSYEDRGLGLNKLTMLTNWLSKCQQQNANSDDQDSLRGEVDIGDERQLVLTEDDLIMNRVEDAPSINLQDPEEVIQRGQEVSHTFLQEIQNAMEIVSTTSSQGEGEGVNLLPEHIAIQDEDNGILLCKRCQKSFVFDDCKKHMKCKEKKSTSARKIYECTFCDKKCRSSSHLKYHIRSVHTGERPYKCTLCSMSFLQIVKLKRHIMTHTGEKPYQCDICHVCFRTGYHLKEHRNIHTKLTHHSCDICSRSFADSSNLRRHMKNLHGKKPASCKSCGQSFPTKHDLMIHKAKENSMGIKQQHICDYCNKTFTTTTSLNKHIILRHMKQLPPGETIKVNDNKVISKENFKDKKTSQDKTSASVKTLQCSTPSDILPIVDNKKSVNFNSEPLIIDKSSISDLKIKNRTDKQKSNVLDGPNFYQDPSQLFDGCDSQASLNDMKVVNEVSSSLLKAIKTSPRFKKSSQVAKIKNPGAINNLFERVPNNHSSRMLAGIKSQTIDPHVSSLSALPLSSFTNSLTTSCYTSSVSAFTPLVASSIPVSASTPLLSSSVARASDSTTTTSLSTYPTSVLSSSGQRLPIVSGTEMAYHLREINQHELNSVHYANAMIKNQLPQGGYLQEFFPPSDLVDVMPSVIQQKDEMHHSLPPVAPMGPDRRSISQHVNLLVKERMGSEPGSSTKRPQSQMSRRQGHIMVPSVHSLPTLTPCESPIAAIALKDDPKLKCSSTENPVNNPSCKSEENELFPSQPWDSLTNLNFQEKAILKILFEENRLDVPAEFLDAEVDQKAVDEVSATINPTKKRFLSRYRNQSGIPAREPKESCDPETLHSLIETSKVLLSSNSIHINLTKEQEQNFILSMLKIIKETNS